MSEFSKQRLKSSHPLDSKVCYESNLLNCIELYIWVDTFIYNQATYQN